ncbi:hypothetical protein PR048_012880 [Dryococelus australis]|uniref:Integrase catalytic domain-containing protein n=1 Tax=Dryococelus australis TaxID=614101 RepID=A0ABQ9HQL9_9NEOP|nr:hypothetical protein PR048_012880 [Dryococelus australis]
MSKDNIFILDSGATNHLVVGSLEEYMSEIRTLSHSVVIKDNIFILDSGATNHLVVGSLEEYMSEIRTLSHSVVIKTANGGEMTATRAGKFMSDYGSGTISFEALIVPVFKNNLLSTVVFSKEKVTIKGKNVSVECEKGHFNLFLLKLNLVTENTKHTIACQEFGEIITTSLQVLNLPFSEEKCPQCLEGKAKRLPFKKNKKSTQSIRELLHSDISGPVKTAIKGDTYFQVIVDDFSHFTTVYLLKTKSEDKENLMNFIKMVKTQHRYTTPYTPQQNSKAERMNLTLINKVKTKFTETDLPCTIWGEAEASAYELNRSPTRALQNRTPALVWFGENDLSKLRAYMLKLPRESKLEPCAKSMIMVRYSGGRYHLLKGKIVSLRDVTMSEK